MSENSEYYKEYILYYYGDKDPKNINFDALKSIVIRLLKENGISKATQAYLQRRKWDRTNDYMLDRTDAMQAYSKRSKPNYKHMCAVLLEGSY